MGPVAGKWFGPKCPCVGSLVLSAVAHKVVGPLRGGASQEALPLWIRTSPEPQDSVWLNIPLFTNIPSLRYFITVTKNRQI